MGLVAGAKVAAPPVAAAASPGVVVMDQELLVMAVVVAALLVASPHTARIGTGGSPHSPPAIAPLWRTLPQTACSPAHSTR